MTKMEEEIKDAITGAILAPPNTYATPTESAKAAAEVAKKYIEKAYVDAVIHWMESEDEHVTISGRAQNYMKENGVIE